MKNNKVRKEIYADYVKKTEEFAFSDPVSSPFYEPSNTAFGRLLSMLIYPESRMHPQNTSTPDNEFEVTIYGSDCGQSLVTSEDYRNAYHMLVFGGNSMQAKDAMDEKLIDIACETNYYIHAAEMPGVSKDSKGQAQNHTHFIKAAILQVEYLLARGADPEKIMLYGFSIGGAISTITAAHCHSQGKKVTEFNDRSLLTLSDVANGWAIIPFFKYASLPLIGIGSFICKFRRAMPLHTSLLVTTALTFGAYIAANSVVKIALRTSKWEMNVGDAWLSIPEGFKWMSYAIDDCVLKNVGGLYRVATGAVQDYIGHPDNNHCSDLTDMLRNDPLGNEITLREDFINLAKRMQVRNEIKDFMISFYATLDAAILNRGDIKLPKELPTIFNHVAEAELTDAMQRAVRDARVLIKEYEAEQNKSNLAKGLRSIYESVRKVFWSIASLVYSHHEGISLDKHLHDVVALTDKIIEVSVNQVVNELFGSDTKESRDILENYQYIKDNPERATNIGTFVAKLNKEVLGKEQAL